MGNSASSSGRHHDETVDGGQLAPQGIYTGPRDWNQAVVSQFICARRLAPFYRPLEEYEDSWDDDQILAARKELPAVGPEGHETVTRIEAPLSSYSSSTKSSHNKRPSSLKEPSRPEAALYRGAVECPICFLYYPPNINHSRCCDQAICTECFVQIKRIEPTTTHLVSEPAACPYCVQDNFGVVYTPPTWRSGIGSDAATPAWADPTRASESSLSYPTHKRRQRSFGADSPEVVTIDHIRPDWEAKLAAVQAAVTRRANRRIIMRQVGDRLIPVGVTSGRVHALSPEEAAAEGVDTGSRRNRRRQQAAQNQNFEQFMGMGGQDLEELMLMEAMRLSMIDHEEHQRKEAEKKKTEAAAEARPEGEASSDTQSPPTPALATSQARPSGSTSLSSSLSTTPLSSSPSALRDSLSSQGSSSFSSRRTPPPPGNYTSSHLNDATTSWRRRTPSPTPYSTLSAAISSTSTASVFSGGTPRHHVSDGDMVNGEAIVGPSIPSILIGASDSTPSIISIDKSRQGQYLLQRPDTPHHDSTAGVSIDGSILPSSSYDHLPSSPESSFAREPLLGSDAASDEHISL